MTDDAPYILCPYCGCLNHASSESCSECHGIFESLSRIATQIAMGPWFVRDPKHPFRPGCGYEIIVKQIQAGKINSRTVLRGPTTHQFWALARNTPGIAHLLGYCHHCRAKVMNAAPRCPACQTIFHKPESRNNLGLQFATQNDALRAQQVLDRKLDELFNQTHNTAAQTSSPAANKPLASPIPSANAAQIDTIVDQAIRTSNATVQKANVSPATNTNAAAPAPTPRQITQAQGMQFNTTTNNLATSQTATTNSSATLVTWLLIVINALVILFILWFMTSRTSATALRSIKQPVVAQSFNVLTDQTTHFTNRSILNKQLSTTQNLLGEI